MAGVQALFDKRFPFATESAYPMLFDFCAYCETVVKSLDTKELDIFIKRFDEIESPVSAIVELFVCRERERREMRHVAEEVADTDVESE